MCLWFDFFEDKRAPIIYVPRVVRVTINRKLRITQGGHWCPLKSVSEASLSLERYIEHNPVKWQNPSSNYHLQIKVLKKY